MPCRLPHRLPEDWTRHVIYGQPAWNYPYQTKRHYRDFDMKHLTECLASFSQSHPSLFCENMRWKHVHHTTRSYLSTS
jgi:hypothetical protein